MGYSWKKQADGVEVLGNFQGYWRNSKQIVGYSAIVRGMKLHVKTKQKKKLLWAWDKKMYKMFGSHNFEGLKNE